MEVHVVEAGGTSTDHFAHSQLDTLENRGRDSAQYVLDELGADELSLSWPNIVI